MDPNREWTAKDDMEALLLCMEKESGPPPPKVDHQKLSEVEKTIKKANKKKKKKYERPVFTHEHLTTHEWELFLDSYEAELGSILTKTSGNLVDTGIPVPPVKPVSSGEPDKLVPLVDPVVIGELAKLEVWFFSFYPPLPKINTVDGIAVWKDQYISFAKRRHSDLLPFEYRQSVSEKVREILLDEWEKMYIQKINAIGEGVIAFRKVNLVKLPPPVRRMVVLKK